MMRGNIGLFLGDNPIPVINWVNRHGSPEGKDLRFTLPTDAKATIEANMGETFTLRRGDDAWSIEFVSLVHHGTGTNGIRAIGRVKGSAAPAKAKAKPAAEPAPAKPADEEPAEPSEVSEAAEAKAAESQDSDFDEKPQTLAEKLKAKLAEKKKQREDSEASEASDEQPDADSEE